MYSLDDIFWGLDINYQDIINNSDHRQIIFLIIVILF